MNKELMEKIASRKWKEKFGGLSSESRKVLRDNFVDEEHYVRGLEKGNKNLIEKMNIKVLPAFPSRKKIREANIDIDAIAKNMHERNIKIRPMKALKGYNLRLPASMMDAATTNTPVIKNFNTEKKNPKPYT